MSRCYLNEKIITAKKIRSGSDSGLMGKSHATSAVSVFLTVIVFSPAIAHKLLGTTDIWTIVLAAIATAGASLLSDLDNTSSSARNSLGPVGHILSELIRMLSTAVQTMIRTGRDNPEPNPHRGFFHTIPAAALLSFGIYFLTQINGTVNLPVVGKMVWGDVAGLVIMMCLLHLALSGLAKASLNKFARQNPLGEVGVFAVSFFTIILIFSQTPQNAHYEWLAVSVFVGFIIHILGDCLTTAGAPLLFPLPWKGKLWYNFRFAGSLIKAGSAIENYIIFPFFLLMIFISIGAVLMRFM